MLMESKMSLSDSLSRISQFKIASVDISDASIQLHLQAGISLGINLSEGRYTNIKNLNKVELNNWCLTDDGCGIYWPAVSRPEKFLKSPMIDVIDLLWERSSDIVMSKASEVSWDLSLLLDVDQQIVILWRMEADIYNGGLMQFLCNWGMDCFTRSVSLLQNVNAVQSHKILSDFLDTIRRFENCPDMSQLSDLYGLLTQDDRNEIQRLDEAYWDNPDELVRKIVSHYACYIKELIESGQFNALV